MAGVDRRLAETVLLGKQERDEGGNVHCDRCDRMLLPNIPKSGVVRKNEHIRVRYKLPVSSPFGQKSEANVIVMCGMCCASFEARGPIYTIAALQEWAETLEQDQEVYDKVQERMEQAQSEASADLAAAGGLQVQRPRRATQVLEAQAEVFETGTEHRDKGEQVVADPVEEVQAWEGSIPPYHPAPAPAPLETQGLF